MRSLQTSQSPAAPVAFGVFNGFLPCPLVYAFAAQAASTAAPLSGLLVMLSFGLGTFPAMLMMGGVGRVLAPAWRQRGVWLAGSFILLLGLITLGRGVLPLARPCRTCLGNRISRMSERGDHLCSHCLLPVGLRAMQRTVNGEDMRVLLLWLLHRLSGEARQERGVGGRLVADPARRGRLSHR